MPSAYDISKQCAALHTRMAARSITRAYDEALRPVNIKITQFSLLVAISLGAPRAISQLAEQLAMDRTTLTRNLTLLEKRGLVEVGAEGFRRSRAIRITPAGEDLLERATPLWEKTQRKLEQDLGNDNWQQAQSLLKNLARTG